uniref:Uncharacterized protein n=2 Tax=Spongospora subterranea TaxID=70186 RepID=A0A0H5QSK3_9EUKA|eukprot:CRZ04925.1 hypothetical protein [Spongospora subterranea]
MNEDQRNLLGTLYDPMNRIVRRCCWRCDRQQLDQQETLDNVSTRVEIDSSSEPDLDCSVLEDVDVLSSTDENGINARSSSALNYRIDNRHRQIAPDEEDEQHQITTTDSTRSMPSVSLNQSFCSTVEDDTSNSSVVGLETGEESRSEPVNSFRPFSSKSTTKRSFPQSYSAFMLRRRLHNEWNGIRTSMMSHRLPDNCE